MILVASCVMVTISARGGEQHEKEAGFEGDTTEYTMYLSNILSNVHTRLLLVNFRGIGCSNLHAEHAL
jgi:hypothetical protein